MAVLLDTNVVSEMPRPLPNPAVAKRNVRDFEGMGIEVINPWSAE